MKILRLFDSLKFLRTIFVAIACAFFIFPAHAELQDTELPVGYKRLTGLKLESASIKITDFYLTGNDTLRFRAKSSAASNWIGSYTTSSADNNYSFYASMTATGKYARYNGQTGGSGVSSGTWYSVVMSPNGVSGVRNPSSWTPSNFTCSVPLYIGNMGEGNLAPAPNVSFSGNIVVDGRLTLIPCERESDGVMGYYSLQHNSFFTSNIGTITSLGYDTSHMVEVPIKIATTKYNEQQFAPVETRLDAAVAAVDTVVTQTMTQAQAIDQIANEKQTRPDEGCTAKYCLLVEDEDGTPHWYPIAGANGVAHNLPAGYTELQYIIFNGNQFLDTGYTPNQGTRIESKFYGTTDLSWIYGTGISAPRITAYLSKTGNQRFGNLTVADTNISANTLITLVQDKGMFNWNGNVKSYGSQNNFTALNTLTIGISNGSTSTPSFSGDFYYMKIYENDAMVRDFVPAKRNSDNEIGMYDLADPNPSTAFYTNAGTGEFTAGPEM